MTRQRLGNFHGLVLLILWISNPVFSCSCWSRYANQNQQNEVKEFIGVVVGGDAIFPATEEERRKWRRAGQVTTEIKVVDPLNSRLRLNQVVKVQQNHSLCTQLFLPLVEY